MLVIRRLVDRHRAYTGIFLPGDPPRIFPTTDAEHARILQIYLQDKPYEGVHNDFTALSLRDDADTRSAPPSPTPAAASKRKDGKQTQRPKRTQRARAK